MDLFTKNIFNIVSYPFRFFFRKKKANDFVGLKNLPIWTVWVLRIILVILAVTLFFVNISDIILSFSTAFTGDVSGLYTIAPFGEAVSFFDNGGFSGFWDVFLSLVIIGLQAMITNAFVTGGHKMCVEGGRELTKYGFLNRLIVMILCILFTMGSGPIFGTIPREAIASFLGKSAPDFWQFFVIVLLFVFSIGICLHSLADILLNAGAMFLIAILLGIIVDAARAANTDIGNTRTVLGYIFLYIWTIGSYVEFLQYETGKIDDEIENGFLRVLYWSVTFISALIGKLLSAIEKWFYRLSKQ